MQDFCPVGGNFAVPFFSASRQKVCEIVIDTGIKLS